MLHLRGTEDILHVGGQDEVAAVLVTRQPQVVHRMHNVCDGLKALGRSVGCEELQQKDTHVLALTNTE